MAETARGSKELPIYKMRKQDLLRKIHEMGGDADPTWTVEELRCVASALCKVNKVQTADKLVNSMAKWRKEKLVEECARLNILVGDNDTKGTLLGKIRVHLRMEEDTNATDRYPIGRYGGLTYQQIMDKHPAYCAWVVATEKNRESEGNSCSPELTRFAKWIMADKGYANIKGMVDKHTLDILDGMAAKERTTTKVERPTSARKSDDSWSVVTSPRSESTAPSASTAAIEAQNQRIERMEAMMQALLEAVQGEGATRKVRVVNEGDKDGKTSTSSRTPAGTAKS